MDNLPDLLGTAQLSTLLGIKSKGYLIRMLRKNNVPVINIGHRKVVVKRTDFLDFIRRKELLGRKMYG